jgi:hypothetical protein
MGKATSGIQVFMGRDFTTARAYVAGQGHMPAPAKPLVIPEQKTPNSPVVELFEGSLRYYPLKLSDILLGEKLRAYFDFWCADREHPLTTCFDRQQLDIREKELLAFAYEPVAEWNLIQIHVAKKFIDYAPLHGRAISLEALGNFQKDPHHFYADMTKIVLPKFQ